MYGSRRATGTARKGTRGTVIIQGTCMPGIECWLPRDGSDKSHGCIARQPVRASFICHGCGALYVHACPCELIALSAGKGSKGPLPREILPIVL